MLAPALKELEKARKLAPDWVSDIYAAIAEVYYNAVAESYYLSGPTWGDYERAWENAERARDKSPDSAVGYVALGAIYVQQEKWEQAIKQYEKAIEIEPDDTDGYLALSNIYSSQFGDVERAIAPIDKVTEVASTASGYYTILIKGMVYSSVRRYQQAIEQYEKAKAEDPNLIDAYRALGDLYQNQGKLLKAEEEYNKVIELNPGVVDGYLALADLYTSQEKLESAIACCQKALTRKISKEKFLYFRLDSIYQQQGRFKELEEIWHRLVQLDSMEEYTRHCVLGNAYLAEAWKFRTNFNQAKFLENTVNARTRFEQGIEKEPKRAWAYILLGELAVLSGDVEKLRELERLVSDRTPWATYDFWVAIGQAYLKKFQGSEAEAFLNRASELSPHRTKAWEALSDLYTWQGNPTSVARVWAKLVRINSSLRYQANLATGNAYQQVADYKRARRKFTKAQHQEPDTSDAYSSLALLDEAESKWDEAIANYRALEKFANLLASDYVTIARIQREQAKYKEAETAARTAILTNPEQSDGYIVLGRIGVNENNEELIQEARTRLNSIIHDQPYDINKLYEFDYNLAEVYNSMGAYPKAQSIYNSCIEQAPERADAYIGLGMLLLGQEEYDPARENLLKAKRIDSTNIEVYSALSQLFYEQGDVQGVKDAQQQLTALMPAQRYNEHIYIAAAYEKAYETKKSADLAEQAEQQYRAAIKLSPWCPEAYIGLGLLFTELNRHKEAEKVFQLGKEEAEIDYNYLYLGQYYEEEEKFQKALKVYQLGITYESEEFKADLYLSIAFLLHQKLDRLADAEKNYRQAIELASNQSTAYIWLMQLLVDQQRVQETIQVCKQMAQQPELKYDAYLMLGGIFSEQEQYRESEQAYQKASEIDPQKSDAYLKLAYLYQQQHELDRAESFYRLAISVSPTDADTYIGLAQLLVEQGQVNEAIEILNQMAQQPELKYNAYVSLGSLLSGQGQYNEAERAYQQAIEADSRQIDSYLGLASLYQQQNRLDAAEQLIRQVLELEPKNVTALTLLGSFLVSQEQFDEAEPVLQKAIQNDPANAEAYFNLGQIYEQQNKLDRAEEMYSKTLELLPKYGDAYVALGRIYGKQRKIQSLDQMAQRILELNPKERYGAHLVVALAYQEAGYSKQAEETYRRAIVEGSELPDAYVGLMGLLVHQNRLEEATQVCHQMEQQAGLAYNARISLGNLFAEAENYNEAERAYQRAIKTAPQQPDAYLALAHLYQQQNELGKAESVYHQLVSVNPERVEAYLGLGQFLQDQGRVDEAIRVCTQMAQQPELKYNAYISLGYLLSEQERYSESERAYQQAIEADSQQAETYLELAVLYQQQNELDKAEQILSQGLEAIQDYPYFYWFFAQLCDRQQQWEKALQFYSDAAKHQPDPVQKSAIYEARGDSLIQQERYSDAEEALLQALKYNPSNAGACFSLGEVYGRQNELDRAAEMYTKTIQIDSQYLTAYMALCRVYGKQGDVAGIGRTARQIESLQLETAEQYQANLEIAQSYVNAHLEEWAIEQLRKAVELDQNLPDAHIQLAEIFVSLKEWPKARNEYEIVGQLSPERKPDVYLKIGNLFVQEDKLKEAENAYLQAIEADPKRADAYLALGRVYMDLNRWEEAEKAFRQAISLAPEQLDIAPNAYLLIADILRSQGKNKEMQEACAHVISLVQGAESPDYNALRQQGLAYFMQGNHTEAELALNKALEANPADARARFYLALDLLCLEQPDRAEELLQQGIESALNESYYESAIREAKVLADQRPEVPGAKKMLQTLIETSNSH
ncbi:MAG: tetratricopeptide repeat protein [Spirulina sp.]